MLKYITHMWQYVRFRRSDFYGSILVYAILLKEVLLFDEELILILAFAVFIIIVLKSGIYRPIATQLDMRSTHIMGVIEQFMISRIEILQALKTIYNKMHTTISRGEKLTLRTYLRIVEIKGLGAHLRYENRAPFKNAFFAYELNTALMEEVLLLKDVYKFEIELYVNSCQNFFESEENDDELLEIGEEEEVTITSSNEAV